MNLLSLLAFVLPLPPPQHNLHPMERAINDLLKSRDMVAFQFSPSPTEERLKELQALLATTTDLPDETGLVLNDEYVFMLTSEGVVPLDKVEKYIQEGAQIRCLPSEHVRHQLSF